MGCNGATSFYYDRGFCYPISHERISGELAICPNKNPKSLKFFYILFTAEYFNGQQQNWISQQNQ